MLHQRCMRSLLWNGWRWHRGKCNAGGHISPPKFEVKFQKEVTASRLVNLGLLTQCSLDTAPRHFQESLTHGRSFLWRCTCIVSHTNCNTVRCICLVCSSCPWVYCKVVRYFKCTTSYGSCDRKVFAGTITGCLIWKTSLSTKSPLIVTRKVFSIDSCFLKTSRCGEILSFMEDFTSTMNQGFLSRETRKSTSRFSLSRKKCKS